MNKIACFFEQKRLKKFIQYVIVSKKASAKDGNIQKLIESFS